MADIATVLALGDLHLLSFGTHGMGRWVAWREFGRA